MFGLEMMLKQMGLDPEQIKQQVEGFGQVVLAIKDSLDRIEAQNAAIAAHLEITIPSVTTKEDE